MADTLSIIFLLPGTRTSGPLPLQKGASMGSELGSAMIGLGSAAFTALGGPALLATGSAALVAVGIMAGIAANVVGIPASIIGILLGLGLIPRP